MSADPAATESHATRHWRLTGNVESSPVANWLFLQWMLLRRVLGGHSPFQLTALMAAGNVAVGIGGFYFMSTIIGSGSALTRHEYALYGGAINFMAVGVAMNQLLTVGMTAIAHAIVDERNQGTLGYWALAGRRMVPLVLRASMGEFLLACVNAVGTFVILVLLFRVRFDVNLLTFAVMLVISITAVTGVGLAAAGLFLGGYTGQNPVIWLWGLTTTFIAGVFVPVQVFDVPAVTTVAQFVPSTHALAAMRSAVLRGAALNDPIMVGQLVPWLVFAIVMLPVGIWVFERGLHSAFLNGRFVQT